MGKGRANNLLRYILGMPLKEEQDLKDAAARGEDTAKAKSALAKTVRPVLPGQHSLKELQARLDPAQTVVITCGNPWSMEDIKHAAETNGMRFERGLVGRLVSACSSAAINGLICALLFCTK